MESFHSFPLKNQNILLKGCYFHCYLPVWSQKIFIFVGENFNYLSVILNSVLFIVNLFSKLITKMTVRSDVVLV
jgi:hypothetical protein